MKSPGRFESSSDLAPATDRVRIVALVAAGAVFVGLMVLVLILRDRGEAREEQSSEVPLETEASNNYIELLEETLAEKPCDRKTVVELASELNKVRRFEETVAETMGFVERCGDYPYLLWKTYYAHEQLSQWEEAAEVAGALIAADPRDSDYWWWRAKARERAGDRHRAVADYRQAIANSRLQRSNGAHVLGLADLAEEAGVACEAADALRLYIDAQDNEVGTRFRDRLQSLALSGGCRAPKRARGAATIPLDPGALVSAVEARLDEHRTDLVVDPRAGLTVVGAALAAELGLEPSGPEVATFAIGDVMVGRTARIGSIHVLTASARDVDVLVTDDLPDGIEGVLGLSYLWRFIHVTSPEKIDLVAR